MIPTAQYEAKKAKARKRGRTPGVFCIEGEYLTHAQIAARLGCCVDTSRSRMVAVVGPVTWAALEVRK